MGILNLAVVVPQVNSKNSQLSYSLVLLILKVFCNVNIYFNCYVFDACIPMPQMVVALGAGPWDALFGGGNEPAFSFAALFALAAGVVALVKLPRLSRGVYTSTVSGHGFG